MSSTVSRFLRAWSVQSGQAIQPSRGPRRFKLSTAVVCGLLTLMSTPTGASDPRGIDSYVNGCISYGASSFCPPNAPTIVSAAPRNIAGFAVTSNGTVYAGGGAAGYPPEGPPGVNHVPLNAPIVSMTGDPLSPIVPYWLLGADGGVFALAGAPFFGSMAGTNLNAPMVGITPTPTGLGYWLVAADGGVFALGDAGFFGSTAGLVLNAPIVGMVATPSGMGYWLVARDGGVFAFGDAGFYGSLADTPLNAPIVAIYRPAGGLGYWLFGRDGGVFAFGDAPFAGSFLGASGPIVGGWDVELPGPPVSSGLKEYCVATSRGGQMYCIPT